MRLVMHAFITGYLMQKLFVVVMKRRYEYYR